MKTVYCPVLDRPVDGTTCIEIVDVSDGLLNPRILKDYAEKVIWNEDQRQRCLHCEWHADVDEGHPQKWSR